MAFETIERIQQIRSYAEAMQAYDSIKPLRGCPEQTRPIGARRDKQYKIIRIGADIQSYTYAARLYDTNLITYNPDNTIVIDIPKAWPTATTMQFIEAVLGIPTARTRGSCVFQINGVKHALRGDKSTLVLLRNNNRYEVLQSQTHKEWRINRTGANAVRRRVKMFRNYLKGFISLRADQDRLPTPTMDFDTEELVAVLGTTNYCEGVEGIPSSVPLIDTRAFFGLDRKRQYHTDDGYLAKMEAFYNLIRDDQPEDKRTDNYYKAALGVLAARHMWRINADIPRTYEFFCYDAIGYLDEVLFKYFADEVFVMRDVPEGKVPSNKYDTWMYGLKNTRED
jgi:hypothetical protein